MEEKRFIKIRLITMLLIIVLIIIAIIGFYSYKINMTEKSIIENSNNSIDNNIVDANSSILQDEDAEKMAKKILDKYINLKHYENNNIGPMPDILVELGLETRENINILISGTTDTTAYIKSNTKYEEFKEALLQYMTEKYFLEKFSQYKNIDGYVGFCNCAAGKNPLEVEKITLSSVNEDKYTFNIVFKDLELYNHYLNLAEGENITEEEYLFNTEVIFEYVNNKLVISKWE